MWEKLIRKEKYLKEKFNEMQIQKTEKEYKYENEILENEFVAIFDCPNVISTNEKGNKKDDINLEII